MRIYGNKNKYIITKAYKLKNLNNNVDSSFGEGVYINENHRTLTICESSNVLQGSITFSSIMNILDKQRNSKNNVNMLSFMNSKDNISPSLFLNCDMNNEIK